MVEDYISQKLQIQERDQKRGRKRTIDGDQLQIEERYQKRGRKRTIDGDQLQKCGKKRNLDGEKQSFMLQKEFQWIY